MSAHCIRLRGPWEYRCGELRGRITLPGNWLAALPAGCQGEVCFTRRFHRPTGLDERSLVELVTSDLPASARVTLNGTPLAASRSDVSALLKPQNLVEVQFALPAEGTIQAEVWLEIL